MEGYTAHTITTGNFAAYAGADAMLSVQEKIYNTFYVNRDEIDDGNSFRIQVPLVLRLQLRPWCILLTGMQLHGTVEWDKSDGDRSLSDRLTRYNLDYRATPLALHFAIDDFIKLTFIPALFANGLSSLYGEGRLFF